MDFNGAERSYQDLRNQLNNRKITSEQFQIEVAKLRIQASDGAWWQVEPVSGGWLKWDGSTWVESTRPGGTSPALTPPPGHGGSAKALGSQKKKESLMWGCIFYFLKRLILIGLSFGAGYILHTYLLVRFNNGFDPETEIPLGFWLNTTGLSASAFPIWTFGFGLFWSFLIAFFTRGPVKAIGAIIGAPFRIFSSVGKTGMRGLGAILMGSGVAIVIAAVLPINNEARLGIGLSWFLMMMNYPGMYGAHTLRNFFRLFSPRKPLPLMFDRFVLQLVFASMSFGLIITMILKVPAVGLILAAIGLVVLIVSGVRRPSLSQVTMFLLTIGGVGLVYALLDFLFALPVHADDGGWVEFQNENPDGTFQDWLNYEGADIALERGWLPGLAAGLGALAPPLTGDVPSDDEPDWVRDLPQDQQDRNRDLAQALIQAMDNGQLPEGYIVRAGFDVPSLGDIYDRLRGALQTITGEEQPDEWNADEIWDAQKISKAGLTGIAMALFMLFTGKIALGYAVVTGLAAGLADYFGCGPNQVIDHVLGESEAEPEPEPPPVSRGDDYNIHTDFQRIEAMTPEERIELWSNTRSYWRQYTENTPTTPEEWKKLQERVNYRAFYELEPKIHNGTASDSERYEYHDLYNEWHVLRSIGN